MLILDGGRVLVAGSVGEVIEMAVVERSAQLRVPTERCRGPGRPSAAYPG